MHAVEAVLLCGRGAHGIAVQIRLVTVDGALEQVLIQRGKLGALQIRTAALCCERVKIDMAEIAISHPR